MARKFLAVVTIVGFVVITVISLFVYRNFRGAGPAILPPKPIIQEAVERPQQIQNDIGLTLPPGFSITIFARDLSNPRVVREDPNGALIVSIPGEGRIIRLPDEDQNGLADRIDIVADGLRRPHGLDFDCASDHCWLYVAETNRIARYEYQFGERKSIFDQVLATLPEGGNHWTRTAGLGPDGRLYVSIGSSCNVCIEKDQRRAAVYSMSQDGSDFEPFATGLRNSVFFIWHPMTKTMWAMEMGRDLLGDDLPPDEINIVEEGKDYGWPYCYGKNTHDSNYDKTVYPLEKIEFGGNICDGLLGKTASHIDLPAHSAPLGLAFVPENSAWPKEYWGDLLVAFHGSWNRTVPTGYKIIRVKLDENGNSEGIEDFITGWLTESGEATGRPVDLLFAPDGSLYITDDKAGVIYRVQWRGTP